MEAKGRRFYDPDTGRFLTSDSQNLYAYVLNDPLLRIDLYGLEGSLWDHSKQAYYGSMQGVGRFAMGAAM